MEIENLLFHGLRSLGLEEREELIEVLKGITYELVRWGKRLNLTGFKEPELIIKRLVFEALYLLRFLEGREIIGDLGSGSGMMAFVFALALKAKVISIERNQKKVNFQKHIKRTFKIENLEIILADMLTVDPLGLDACLVKAIRVDEALLEKLAVHLRPKGILLIPKGSKSVVPSSSSFSLEKVEFYRLPLSQVRFKLFVLERV